MRLAQQECEIEQLRKQLACEPCSPVPCMPYLPCQCQCGDSGNSIIDCWRRELMSVLAKNREGMAGRTNFVTLLVIEVLLFWLVLVLQWPIF